MTAVDSHAVAQTGAPALDVRNLSVSASHRMGKRRQLLDNISFTVMPGEALGVVGESGSGKSLTSLSILSLLPRGLRRDGGEILLGENGPEGATFVIQLPLEPKPSNPG